MENVFYFGNGLEKKYNHILYDTLESNFFMMELSLPQANGLKIYRDYQAC